jgi:hypothetical protein
MVRIELTISKSCRNWPRVTRLSPLPTMLRGWSWADLKFGDVSIGGSNGSLAFGETMLAEVLQIKGWE